MLLVFLGVTFLLYLILNLPVKDKVSCEKISAITGKSKFFLSKYLNFLIKCLNMDFDDTNRKLKKVKKAVIYTLILEIPAVILALIIAIPLSVFVLKHKEGIIDTVTGIILFTFSAIPVFFLCMILMVSFCILLPEWSLKYLSVKLGLPLTHLSDYLSKKTVLEIISGGLKYYILPFFTMLIISVTLLMRMSRMKLLEVLNQDYIIAARARGLGDFAVYYKHALKNSIIPVLSVTTYILPFLFSNGFIVEVLYNWPGLGKLTYISILKSQYSVLTMCLLFIAIIILSFNLLLDCLIFYLSPKK